MIVYTYLRIGCGPTSCLYNNLVDKVFSSTVSDSIKSNKENYKEFQLSDVIAQPELYSIEFLLYKKLVIHIFIQFNQ